MSRRTRTLIAVLCLMGLSAIALHSYHQLKPILKVVLKLGSSQARLALPQDVQDVHEYGSGFVDYVRLVKAKIPEQEYTGYVSRMGLRTKYDPALHGEYRSTLHMSFSDAPRWWDPPDGLEGCFFNFTPGSNHYEISWFHNGYVYYCSTSW
jgi:hypothetical protein